MKKQAASKEPFGCGKCRNKKTPMSKHSSHNVFFFRRAQAVLLCGILFCSLPSLPVQAKSPANIIQLFVAPDAAIFALTEEKSGLFYSTDNGLHWKQAKIPAQLTLYAMATDRNGRLFLTTDKGIYRSDNHGRSWGSISESHAAFASFSKITDEYLIKLWGKGLYSRLTEGDRNNKAIKKDQGLPDFPVQTTVFGPGNIPFAGFFGKGVYRRPGKDKKWVPANTGLGNTNVLILACSPDGTLYAGTYGGGLYRWEETSYSWIAVDLGFSPAVVQCLEFAEDGPIFVGTLNNGILFSSDQGKTWRQQGIGLDKENIQSIAQAGDGTLFAAAYNTNLYALSPGGTETVDTTWQPRLFADTTKVYRVAMTSQGTWYAAIEGMNGLMAGTDRGRTWIPITLPFPCKEPNITFVADQERIIVATPEHGPFVSYDQGKNWQKITTGLPEKDAYNLLGVRTLAKSKNNIIYGLQGGGRGLYRLAADNSWERVEAQGEQCKHYRDINSIFLTGILFFPDDNVLLWGGQKLIIARNNFSSWMCEYFGQSGSGYFIDADSAIWTRRMLSTFALPYQGDEWHQENQTPTPLYSSFQHIAGKRYLGIRESEGLDVVQLYENGQLQVLRHCLQEKKVRTVAAGTAGFLVGTNQGIWFSDNNGATWQEAGFQ